MSLSLISSKDSWSWHIPKVSFPSPDCPWADASGKHLWMIPSHPSLLLQPSKDVTIDLPWPPLVLHWRAGHLEGGSDIHSCARENCRKGQPRAFTTLSMEHWKLGLRGCIVWVQTVVPAWAWRHTKPWPAVLHFMFHCKKIGAYFHGLDWCKWTLGFLTVFSQKLMDG